MRTQERRQFPRLDVNVKIRYKILTNIEKHMLSDFDSYVGEARSKNISVDGVRILSESVIEPNTIIGLELFFPEQKAPIRALGRAVWSKPLGKQGEYYTGVEFVAIKDRYFDQMSQLMAEYVVNKYKINELQDRRGLIGILTHLFKRKKSGDVV